MAHNISYTPFSLIYIINVATLDKQAVFTKFKTSDLILCTYLYMPDL